MFFFSFSFFKWILATRPRYNRYMRCILLQLSLQEEALCLWDHVSGSWDEEQLFTEFTGGLRRIHLQDETSHFLLISLSYKHCSYRIAPDTNTTYTRLLCSYLLFTRHLKYIFPKAQSWNSTTNSKIYGCLAIIFVLFFCL